MIIPMPYKLGDFINSNGLSRQFYGVNFYKWMGTMEYTYFFQAKTKNSSPDFYVSRLQEQPYSFVIPDLLTVDGPIKDKGYPLRSQGHVCGIYYKNNKTYVDFIITGNYYEHIRVQCDNSGKYIPNGDIIFPTGWDTEEKRERAILKSFKFITGDPLVIKDPESRQLTIFDFIS